MLLYHHMIINSRMRRMRNLSFSRNLMRETTLTKHDLIQPLFVIAGNKVREPIATMPGINRLSIDLLVTEAVELHEMGINAVALFPAIAPNEKSLDAAEAYNPNGLIPNAIKALKDKLPDLGVITDLALDPYTSHGQDGVTDSTGYVLNDATVEILCQQALSHAKAGVDIVAPSDMMDGRVGEIRNILDIAGFIDINILAYSAKYASCLYGPFRDAVQSSKNLGKSSKHTYQMDIANTDEAVREAELDIIEGADMIMVKPAMSYLDVLYRIKQEFKVPTFAYQVSGEYSMLMAAINAGFLERDAAILETLTCIKRAGADAIISYFAKDAAKLLS